LGPSNVRAARESTNVDGMADCDMGEVNFIPNQYDVYLDLIFFNNPSMLRVSEAETSLLKLDRHHLAFLLTCNIEYLGYVSMCRRVSRFDFCKPDVDKMILQLSAVDWSDLLRSD
jgi:hypothetical protein